MTNQWKTRSLPVGQHHADSARPGETIAGAHAESGSADPFEAPRQKATRLFRAPPPSLTTSPAPLHPLPASPNKPSLTLRGTASPHSTTTSPSRSATTSPTLSITKPHASTSTPAPAPTSAPSPADQSVGMIILRRRMELGCTQDLIAERAGIAKSYVSQIENQVRKGPPSEDILRKLERALHLPSGALVEAARWENTPASVKRYVRDVDGAAQVLATTLRAAVGRGSLDELHRSGELERLVAHIERASPTAPTPPTSLRLSPTPSQSPRETHAPKPAEPAHLGTDRAFDSASLQQLLPTHIPVINSVAAGHAREFTDLDLPAGIADDYVRSPNLGDREAFAARITGESMMPDYHDGDIVIFSPAQAIANGSDCFVRFEDRQESTFKRIFFDPPAAPSPSTAPSGQSAPLAPTHIRLQPLNPAFPTRIVEREAIAAIYAAVNVTRAIPRPSIPPQ